MPKAILIEMPCSGEMRIKNAVQSVQKAWTEVYQPILAFSMGYIKMLSEYGSRV